MDLAEYREVILGATERVIAVASIARFDSPVPTCPDWDLGELIFHLGGVHRWAAEIVRRPVTDLAMLDRGALVGTRPSDGDLLEWLADGASKLVATLESAPVDLECWSIFPTSDPKRTWSRRQAHETVIHRVDAELACGADPVPFGTELAADNLDELLTDFLPRSAARYRSPNPRRLGVVAVDSGDAWSLEVGSSQLRTIRGDGGGDARLVGPVRALDLAMWKRGGIDGLSLEGDPTVVEEYLALAFLR